MSRGVESPGQADGVRTAELGKYTLADQEKRVVSKTPDNEGVVRTEELGKNISPGHGCVAKVDQAPIMDGLPLMKRVGRGA